MAINIRHMKSFLGLREPLSGLTHFAGLLLSIAGLVWLVYDSVKLHNVLATVSVSVFGVSLILLYLSSTLYHSLKLKESRIIFLKRLDHMMIFVLIAGTYTPVCLIVLNGVFGWSSLALIWGLAFLGILFKIFWLDMPRWVYVSIYVMMGWFAVFLLPVMTKTMNITALALLGAGGIVYSVGAVIYALKWPNFKSGIWEFHETWHVFVLAGSICHFLAIWQCL